MHAINRLIGLRLKAMRLLTLLTLGCLHLAGCSESSVEDEYGGTCGAPSELGQRQTTAITAEFIVPSDDERFDLGTGAEADIRQEVSWENLNIRLSLETVQIENTALQDKHEWPKSLWASLNFSLFTKARACSPAVYPVLNSINRIAVFASQPLGSDPQMIDITDDFFVRYGRRENPYSLDLVSWNSHSKEQLYSLGQFIPFALLEHRAPDTVEPGDYRITIRAETVEGDRLEFAMPIIMVGLDGNR